MLTVVLFIYACGVVLFATLLVASLMRIGSLEDFRELANAPSVTRLKWAVMFFVFLWPVMLILVAINAIWEKKNGE